MRRIPKLRMLPLSLLAAVLLVSQAAFGQAGQAGSGQTNYHTKGQMTAVYPPPEATPKPPPVVPVMEMRLYDWPPLIKQKRCQDALQLCTSYVYANDTSDRVGAQKCLANVELCSGKTISQAMLHISVALRMAPQDLTIHMERMHLLEQTGNYDEMAKALEESCNIYKGKDALQAWMKVTEELIDQKQYKAGLAFTQMVDKYYPRQAKVYYYMGMFQSALGMNDAAIASMQHAVSLSSKDPDIAWEMALIYDSAGKVDLANHWYKRALPMSYSAHDLMVNTCSYAQFAEHKLNQRQRACQMERMSCEENQQTACAPQAIGASQKR